MCHQIEHVVVNKKAIITLVEFNVEDLLNCYTNVHHTTLQ